MSDDRLDRIERSITALSHNVGIVVQQQRLILEALHLNARIAEALDAQLAPTIAPPSRAELPTRPDHPAPSEGS